MLGISFVNPSVNFSDVVAVTSLRTAKKKITAVFVRLPSKDFSGAILFLSTDYCG